MKRSKIGYRLAAVLTAGVLMSEGTTAHAGATFSNVAENIEAGSASLPVLISTVAYIGGIGLGVAGIFKLKQHVDNPGQTPMKDGLVRLGAGGGLLALPYITTAMTNTISANGPGSATGFSAFTGIPTG